jgi:hypothetical protein
MERTLYGRNMSVLLSSTERVFFLAFQGLELPAKKSAPQLWRLIDDQAAQPALL